MARKAGDARRPTEETLVDRLHHADHLPRTLHARRHVGKLRAIECRLRYVAEGAVVAHRVGEHPHRVEERIHGNVAEDRHALEDVLRHDRAIARGAWCLSTQPGYSDETGYGYGRGSRKNPASFRTNDM